MGMGSEGVTKWGVCVAFDVDLMRRAKGRPPEAEEVLLYETSRCYGAGAVPEINGRRYFWYGVFAADEIDACDAFNAYAPPYAKAVGALPQHAVTSKNRSSADLWEELLGDDPGVQGAKPERGGAEDWVFGWKMPDGEIKEIEGRDRRPYKALARSSTEQDVHLEGAQLVFCGSRRGFSELTKVFDRMDDSDLVVLCGYKEHPEHCRQRGGLLVKIRRGM